MWRREPIMAVPTAQLQRGGFRILEREQIDRLRRSVAAVQQLSWQTEVSPSATRDVPANTNKRPNYLMQLKQRINDFTWGE